MKKKNKLFVIVVGLTLVIAVSMAFAKYGVTDQGKASLQMIDSEKLTAMITSNENMVIVDLREPDLFAAGRVSGAVNIPFDQIGTRYKELPKDKKVVFVCHTGRMGTESGNLLLENGYKQVYNLEGGMAKWSGVLEK